MGKIVVLRPQSASPTTATLRAILGDTADLLDSLKGADEAERVAMDAQVSAINEVLGAAA